MAFSLALGVTPERLKSKSGDVSASIEAMIANIQTMTNEVNETGYYWRGDAGERQRKRFNDNVDEINRLLIRLRTYPTRILQMAGIYEGTEEANEAISSSLKPDIEMRG